MDLTTTPSIEGKTIKKYCGFSLERRSSARTVQRPVRQRASELGANAVVGIDLDYEVMGPNNGMLMVSASGTAVLVE